MEEYQQKKGELQEEISHLEREIDNLKQERKATKKHITIAELPEDERFSRLSTKITNSTRSGGLNILTPVYHRYIIVP